MELRIFQVDAFADALFRGNPAAVCPLDAWLPDALMQAIAMENNLSETAFFVGGDGCYALRWFTPAAEVDLCGHATLASAFVVFEQLEPQREDVRFDSASGPLRVRRAGALLELDFPARPGTQAPGPGGLSAALGATPHTVLDAPYWIAVFDSEATIRRLRPDMAALARIGRAVCATAPGDGVDFVSRFFAPALGVPEDPVTGSAHCTLAPYWAERTGKRTLEARQLSARGGALTCTVRGDRVAIAGRAVLYLEGRIHVEDP